MDKLKKYKWAIIGLLILLGGVLLVVISVRRRIQIRKRLLVIEKRYGEMKSNNQKLLDLLNSLENAISTKKEKNDENDI